MKLLGQSLIAFALAFLFANSAIAAGYEKSIMWGGRTGSVAGISTSYIMGADALYFNPAGLMKDAPGQDLSLNISPVWSTFSGPYNNNNDVVNSTSGFATPFGLNYSNKLNDKWAFGVGGFISGGSSVEYQNIDFLGAVVGAPSTKTDLQVAELSAGVAYKVSSALRVGLAYRYVMARANFSFFQRAYSGSTFAGLVNARLTDLKDQESALRFGVQYALSEATHFGLTYRSEVPLHAAGSIGGDFYRSSGLPAPPYTNGTINSASATADTVFPQAITLGADHAFNETWKGLAEVAWTNYARVDRIPITASTTVAIGGPPGSIAINNPALTQNWKDQWNFRLGGEYIGWSWPLRFGYGLTTQVTDSDWARPTFTPPGPSHTLTAGSGHTFDLGGQKIDFNGAGEYTFVSGDGTGHAAGDNAASTNTDIRAGTHKTSSYALHLGLAYNF